MQFSIHPDSSVTMKYANPIPRRVSSPPPPPHLTMKVSFARPYEAISNLLVLKHSCSWRIGSETRWRCARYFPPTPPPPHTTSEHLGSDPHIIPLAHGHPTTRPHIIPLAHGHPTTPPHIIPLAHGHPTTPPQHHSTR